VSRRHALRLVLGQGAEIARERDARALADEQRTALEGALGARVAPPVVRLEREHADEIVELLAEAFRGYPVMRFVLGDDDAERLRRLVLLFVMARVLRDEPLLGIRDEGVLVAAATTSFPSDAPHPRAFLELRAELWQALGPEAEARYDAYGAATRTFPFDFPHVHLNMVGVRPGARGRGLARRLIDEVQAIARARPGSQGVTLTTEDPTNVAFYEKLGFGVVGRVRVSPTLESWGFLRR
jgi:ribosomal protein S18 acetylase RimI-like enzyme